MAEHILVGLAAIIVLGIGAQWLAWRLHIPSILLLLLWGIIAGPVTGFLRPDRLLGPLLLPVVSIFVAVVLFEGGLTLKFSEFGKAGGVVVKLVTLGLVATWIAGAAAAHYLLQLPLDLALLQGAILVVTGPTVVMPLLRQMRLAGRLNSALKWEGILIDPIGVILAVLTFEVIISREFATAHSLVALGVAKAFLIGTMAGLLGAAVMVLLLYRYWIPDFLHNPVTLGIVVSVFIGADLLYPESGILAATVMGIALANQKFTDVTHIVEFKENLRVLLISCLFIILSARLRISDFAAVNRSGLAFLAVLIIVIRPVAAFLGTAGSRWSGKERIFLAAMAPRGIVAAALASICALDLAKAGHPQAGALVPITFLVIIGTVTFYGLTAPPLARALGLSESDPQGVMIIGAHPLARALALALKNAGYAALLVDTNWDNIVAARMAGLSGHYGNVMSDTLLNEIDLAGIGRLFAMTPNDAANSLAAIRLADVFGKAHTYQLASRAASKGEEAGPAGRLRGRFLFGEDFTYAELSKRLESGMSVKSNTLTEEFDFTSFRKRYGVSAVPLMLIRDKRKLLPLTGDREPKPVPGETLISLVKDDAG